MADVTTYSNTVQQRNGYATYGGTPLGFIGDIGVGPEYTTAMSKYTNKGAAVGEYTTEVKYEAEFELAEITISNLIQLYPGATSNNSGAGITIPGNIGTQLAFATFIFYPTSQKPAGIFKAWKASIVATGMLQYGYDAKDLVQKCKVMAFVDDSDNFLSWLPLNSLTAFTVSSTTPADNATGVVATDPLIITFSDAVGEAIQNHIEAYPTTAGGYVTFAKADGTATAFLTASFNAAGTVLTLTHAALTTGIVYVVGISGQFRDTYGQFLKGDGSNATTQKIVNFTIA